MRIITIMWHVVIRIGNQKPGRRNRPRCAGMQRGRWRLRRLPELSCRVCRRPPADQACLPACRPSLPACLPADQACLPACQPSLPACRPSLPACLPTKPACLPARQPSGCSQLIWIGCTPPTGLVCLFIYILLQTVRPTC